METQLKAVLEKWGYSLDGPRSEGATSFYSFPINYRECIEFRYNSDSHKIHIQKIGGELHTILYIGKLYDINYIDDTLKYISWEYGLKA